MRLRIPTPTLILMAVITLMLPACNQQEAIPVYITPTSDVPTMTPTLVNTLEPPATDTPSQPGTPTTTPRSALLVGPVVGADYTLEPSNTPRPTRTPITPTTDATIPPRPTNTQPPPPGTSVPGLDANQVGVQLYTNFGRDEWDFYLNRTKEHCFRWIKVQASWSFLQPNGPNPDEQTLRTFEINLQTADQAGFNILMSVAKAPPWARGNGQADSPPADPQALADFFNLIFVETKIGEVVDAIEIWNEPNLRREWNTDALPFSGAGYMQLFEPSYNAIKAYNPNIQIVTAGLAPTTTIGNDSIDDRVYLEQMYQNGLGNYTDIAVGAHPYGWGNPPDATCCGEPGVDPGWDEDPHFFFLDNLNETREIMNRNGHQNVQIWPTEFGWATWDDLSVGLPDPPQNFVFYTYNSLEDQMNYTLRALEIGQSRADIGPMFLWNLNFANEISIQNRQEIVGYSLLLPPDENGDIVRRPLAWQLSGALCPAP